MSEPAYLHDDDGLYDHEEPSLAFMVVTVLAVVVLAPLVYGLRLRDWLT